MSELDGFPRLDGVPLMVPLPIQGPTRFNWVSELPQRTSPLWYLWWPQPVIDLVGGDLNPRWFCMPAFTELATESRPQRTYGAYCGAPPGIRCSCGAQLAGHDTGDEHAEAAVGGRR